MKSLSHTNASSINKILICFSVLFFATLISNPLSAQQETFNVKGIVASEAGPLDGVSIYLKGTQTGIISKSDGSFTFPIKLKTGDVVVFSYLGFDKQSVTITKDNTNLNIVLVEAPVDILSALNSNKRFKSKRPKTKN